MYIHIKLSYYNISYDYILCSIFIEFTFIFYNLLPDLLIVIIILKLVLENFVYYKKTLWLILIIFEYFNEKKIKNFSRLQDFIYRNKIVVSSTHPLYDNVKMI